MFRSFAAISMSLFLFCALLVVPGHQSHAADGPALLTVVGKIGPGNRGASDDFMDIFLKFQDTRFDKAHTFDQAALEALPQHKATIQASTWPQAHVFEGPLLSDVLKAAGVPEEATTLKVRALDGYEPEVDITSVRDYPAILALKADGEYLGLGGRGPLWLVFPIQDYPALPQGDDSAWVWAVFYIEVE
ncbi:molybdopterin-dependent oxidoreductase [Rhodovibrionaceae bacterium A322]